ncbi:MFS transporter [Actinosynnema sp. CS-041913]|uniref:MFS transporter n=1 Tax=Actinosynnema sp. CS-041913 TaxID=3239917 RepID=UPI003D926ACF
MFRALRGRNYRRWAFADLVSVTGTWMQLIGLNWVVMERTGSAAAVGLSVLVGALPSVLLGPWAGALADRVPVRRIILACQSLHVVLAVLLALVVWLHAPMPLLFGLTAAAGLVSVFDGPALGRFGGQVVSRDDLGNALALGSILSSTGRILGMSSAAVLAAALGTPALFLINAASFVAVIAAVLTVRQAELHPLASSPEDQVGVRAGLRYVGGSGRLLLLFALGFVLSSLGRNYQVTMAAMSGSATHYGLLSTVFAVGTVLGGLAAAARRTLTIRLLLIAAGTTSVLQAVGGLVPGTLGFALVLVPIAAGAVLIDTTMSTRLQLDSADGMRGRLLAVNGSIGAAAGAVGAPLLGWLCERLGAPETLLLAGTSTLLATVFAATVFAAPAHRRTAFAHRVLRRPHPVLAPSGYAPTTPTSYGHGHGQGHGHGHGSTRPGRLRRRRVLVPQ